MSKFACPFCTGFVHTSGEIPNPREHLLFSDVEWEQLPDAMEVDALYAKAKHMFKCVQCEGFAIFWNGIGELPRWYAPKT